MIMSNFNNSYSSKRNQKRLMQVEAFQSVNVLFQHNLWPVKGS